MRMTKKILRQNGYRALFLAGMAFVSSMPAFAAKNDVVFTETFDTQEAFDKWTKVDVNGGRTWEFLNGAASYMLDYQTGLPGDDWLISPEFKLDDTKVYCLEFKLGIMSRTENLRIALGSSLDPSSFTQVLADYPNVVKKDSGNKTVKVYVKASGTYRLGFYAYSEANMHRIDIDNVTIKEMSAKGVPAHVEMLKLTPAEKGNQQATLTFTTPKLTANDSELTGNMSVEIYRNNSETATKTFSDVTPGTPISWTDTAPLHGDNTYRVVTSNDKGEGESAEVSDFIGIDTPQAVASLKARLNAQRGVSLSWEAPTTSVNGGYVDYANIKYNVYRDGQLLGEPVSTTTFTDNNPVDGAQKEIVYSVEPVADGYTGQLAKSLGVVAGKPLSLPYKESFANQKVSNPWAIDADACDFEWEYMPDDEDGEYEEIVSADKDNGILRALSRNADQGEKSRFVSPLLDLSTVSTPVMTFWFYYGRSAWYDPDMDGEVNDNMRIQVSYDAGEWQDIDNAVFYQNDNSKGWTKCEVYLPQQTGNFAQIGLLATSDHDFVANRNMYIDNITIDEAPHAKDLVLSSFTVDKRRIDIGEKAIFTIGIANHGASTESDYVVNILRDGENVAKLIGEEVQPAMTVNMKYTMEATLDDAQTDCHIWTAEVVAADDENQDNNVSDKLETSVRRPEMPVVTDLTGTNTNGTVDLSWTAVQSVAAVEHGDPIEVTDDFESYTPFVIEGIGDWTTYDGDKASTIVTPRIPNRYEHQGEPMAFQVFNTTQSGTWVEDVNTDGAFKPRSGEQYLVCPSADYPAENDDWLISPRLDGRAQTVTFWGRSATYDLEWISFWYSTTDNHHDSFVKLSDKEHVTPNEIWTEFTYNLPEGAKYFAIRCVRRSVMLSIDDVSYNAYDGSRDAMNVVGYNVYRDGERLNASPISIPKFTDKNTTANSHKYKVTVVYDKGESDYSEEIEVANTTAINGIDADSKTEGTTRYNLGGQRITVPSKGIVIERTADGKVRKTIVR